MMGNLWESPKPMGDPKSCERSQQLRGTLNLVGPLNLWGDPKTHEPPSNHPRVMLLTQNWEAAVYWEHWWGWH